MFTIFAALKSPAMKKKTPLLMHLLFSVIVIVELLGRLLDKIQMEYFVKPLIMIWIAVYFLLHAKKSSFTIPVLLAFFFSWLGDNFLMLSGSNELFFYAGVGGFFCAQVAYIFTFSKYSFKRNYPIKLFYLHTFTLAIYITITLWNIITMFMVTDYKLPFRFIRFKLS